MERELGQLIDACRAVGSDKSLVQGSGGNISLKLGKKTMLVKASGVRLDKVDGTNISLVETSGLKSFAERRDTVGISTGDRKLTRLIVCSSLDRRTKPSMETSFHAILGRAVVHTHPLAVNFLTCMSGGENVVKEIDPSIVWVPYGNPGYSLLRQLKMVNVGDGVYFLQNHGLIVSSDDLEEAVNTTVKINRKIRDGFNLDDYKPVASLEPASFGYIEGGEIVRDYLALGEDIKSQYLFPDAAVFCCGIGEKDSRIRFDGDSVVYRFDRKKAESVDEIMLAHMYLHVAIRGAGRTVSPINFSDIGVLLNMDAEKYRRTL